MLKYQIFVAARMAAMDVQNIEEFLLFVFAKELEPQLLEQQLLINFLGIIRFHFASLAHPHSQHSHPLSGVAFEVEFKATTHPEQ